MTMRLKHLISAVALLLLTACATRQPGEFTIDRSIQAKSQNSRVEFIVLHYTATGNEASLKILSQQNVSSHYLVTSAPEPLVYQLVDESRRAWHAGNSEWFGRTDMNSGSIGIEIVNHGRKDDGTWEPYTAAQTAVVSALLKDIVARHQIKPFNIVGHSDIAPQRKIDPGPLFPWKQLADAGFAATPRYAAVSCNSRSQNSPESRAFFCPNGGGTLGPAVGSLVQNKPLAQTLRLIAEKGADCFYLDIPGCDIARGIVEGQNFNRPQAPGGKGGSMTLADLANYQPALRLPVEGTYRGYTIKSVSPPSSGGLTMIQMLKMLERFPIGDASQGFGFASVKTATVMADAMRIAFADRSQWMADIDFVPVPMRGLLDPSYTGLRGAALVPGARLSPNPIAGDPRVYDTAGLKPSTRLAVAEPVTGPGETTTHFSVVDKWGNFVSYTNTIESSHGIGVFAGYTQADGTFKNLGFLLNNELTDFNTTPTINPYTGGPGFNDVQANKRPRSSMNPTMIFTPHGEPLVAFGSPGGSTIINSVLNVTMNLIDHKMTIQDAINAPRLSVTGTAPTISVDPGYPTATLDVLRSLGYSVPAPADIGSVQAVLVEPKTGKQYGGADPRREGTVIGLPRK